MALQLDSKQYTIDELEKGYSQFFAPSFEISVEGQVIPAEIGISRLEVETTVEAVADTFSFRITNAFDLQKSDFQWLDTFMLGKSIEIKLGYSTKLTPVFSGYITSVVADFMDSETPMLVIRGMDLTFLMMKGNKSKTWNNKKYSDIVTEIARNHGATPHVDATTTSFPALSQNKANDYFYIQHLAQLVNYDFFIVGKNVYFRKPLTESSPVVTLEYGRTLKSLFIDANLAEQLTAVSVRGWDDKELKVIEGKSGAIQKLGSNSKTGKDLLAVQGEYVEYMYTNVTSQEEAAQMATAHLNRRSMKLLSGSGESIGLPEIRAGRYVALSGLGSKYDQPYFIAWATHVLNDDGYVTRFQIGGNAI